MNAAVIAKNLFKEFQSVPAVSNVSFEIQRGECFGILGPNGAGKSTLMKMIYGHVIPNDGELFVLGLNSKTDMSQIRSKIGVVPQDDCLDIDFNTKENLKIFASYHGISSEIAEARTNHLISEMKLTEHRYKKIEALSGGMKRRLVIARGLINNPELLILDEPTTGLDPQARLWIWSYFETLKLQNITMILTTHYMEEAEVLCDRIAIVDQGRILDCDTPSKLIEKHIGSEVVEINVGNEASYWKTQFNAMNIQFQDYDKKLFAFFSDALARQAFISQIQNVHYLIRPANLNDVFLKLAGYQIRANS
ncbi:MAG: ABC transporter ATP-binding protein [Pseudobdellovibrio sp.]